MNRPFRSGRRRRRLRRRLGLPAFRPRTWLLIIFIFLGAAYVSVTVLADFFVKLGEYSSQYYEPKDSPREEQGERR